MACGPRLVPRFGWTASCSREAGGLGILQFQFVTDAAHRTASDDDMLLERLHSLAWGAEGAIPGRGHLPDKPFPRLTIAEVERAE